MRAAFALWLIVAAVADADVDDVTAPVVVDGVQLFSVRGLSSLPAEIRARQIRGRIEAAAADPAVDPSSVRLVELTTATEIEAGGRRMMVVSDADAEMERVPRAVAAHAGRDAIAAAIARWRADRQPPALQRSLLITLAIAAA